jgi:hypothetical protein
LLTDFFLFSAIFNNLDCNLDNVGFSDEAFPFTLLDLFGAGERDDECLRGALSRLVDLERERRSLVLAVGRLSRLRDLLRRR